jgi:hypothetical protein
MNPKGTRKPSGFLQSSDPAVVNESFALEATHASPICCYCKQPITVQQWHYKTPQLRRESPPGLLPRHMEDEQKKPDR